MQLPERLENRLNNFIHRLIDQEAASIIVPPNKNSAGFWFGGGNMVRDNDGSFYLVGRYRNAGDSRTGLSAGERGLELAVFKSTDGAKSFQKVLSFSKADLEVDGKSVLSIEGSALHLTKNGVELFVSTEKDVPYPDDLKEFQKPGTGIWSIDNIAAPSVESLDPNNIRPLFQSDDPRWLHLKDPALYETATGRCVLIACSHPFNWSSTGSFYAVRESSESLVDAVNGRGNGDSASEMKDAEYPKSHFNRRFSPPVFDFFKRGTTWDVAMARVTAAFNVPKTGLFEDQRPVSIFFYDGGECVRKLDEHTRARKRPRGYSCEELGGAAYFIEEDIDNPVRLSRLFPSFVSKWGTGSSRYVDVLETEDGYYATWEQSQSDFSQPLVMNYLSKEDAASILS